MSTPHSIARPPRFRIGLGTLLTALGVLIAIATTITFIALTGANQTTAATPATPSQATAGSTPHIHYLGPRQQSARPNPQTAQIQGGGTTPTTGAGNPAPHYTCLGAAHHCLP
jgi:hypothetical protein